MTRSIETTLSSHTREDLEKRMKNMESRGFKPVSEIVRRNNYFGIRYYVRMKKEGE